MSFLCHFGDELCMLLFLDLVISLPKPSVPNVLGIVRERAEILKKDEKRSPNRNSNTCFIQ